MSSCACRNGKYTCDVVLGDVWWCMLASTHPADVTGVLSKGKTEFNGVRMHTCEKVFGEGPNHVISPWVQDGLASGFFGVRCICS